MTPEDRSVLAWTLATAGGVGGLFTALAAWRAVAAGFTILAAWQPVAALGVIGATVGGLLGPLVRGAVLRRRGR